MNENEIIKKIVAEVLKKLEATPPKESVLVLAQRTCELVAKVESTIGLNFNLLFAGDDLKDSKITRYILPELTCSDMADLAVGKSTSDMSSLVLELLLKGNQVEVLAYDYEKYLNTASGALCRLYKGYREKLISFGLIPVNEMPPEFLRFDLGLVTEKEVRQALDANSPVIEIPVNAIVTPLASEIANELNIVIKKIL